MSKSIVEHEGKKYLRKLTGFDDTDPETPRAVLTDVYAVLEAFSVTCPAVAHCIKKLLCAGQRGNGSALDDLIGAEAALNRAIELERNRIKEHERTHGKASRSGTLQVID